MASAAIGDQEVKDIARAFVKARQENRVLMRYPNGRMPASLDEAYRIQEAAMAIDGRAPLGWKVGRVASSLASEFGNDRLAGPIFSLIDGSKADGEPPIMPVLSGFAAVEGELLARIAPNASVAIAQRDDRAMIDALHLGIEIASSPFPEINGHGPAVTISDFGNNYGAVLGPNLIHHPLVDLFAAEMSLLVDGDIIGTGRPQDVLDGPFGAVRFVIEHVHRRGLGDPGGLWVSCGAVTGVHPVQAGSGVEVRLLDASLRCDTALVRSMGWTAVTDNLAAGASAPQQVGAAG
jgi:2-keto-4-pentenoate hydratase